MAAQSEVSGATYEAVRIRVAFSGHYTARDQKVGVRIGDELTSYMGVDGYAIIFQMGSWKSSLEGGFIVEFVAASWAVGPALDAVRRKLQPLVNALGLTYFVTGEKVTAMEVF